MKQMMTRRYTTAQTAPIVSGLSMRNNSQPLKEGYFSVHRMRRRAGRSEGKGKTHISVFLTLLISFPFRPTRMNAAPSHLIRAYVRAKARPLKAIDATTGAPSPRRVWKMMARHIPERTRRLHVSLWLSVVSVIADC